jgi:hypothetical protein
MHRILILPLLLIFCNCSSVHNKQELPIIVNSSNQYAFIGKKIEILEIANRDIKTIFKTDSITNERKEYISMPMNYIFKAKYEVIQNVYNELKVDTLEFIVLDHYGRPKFEDYENVLLYLHYDNDVKDFYLDKYKFEVVTQKDNGNWKATNGKSLKRVINDYYY